MTRPLDKIKQPTQADKDSQIAKRKRDKAKRGEHIKPVKETKK